ASSFVRPLSGRTLIHSGGNSQWQVISNWFSTDGSVFELGIAEGIAPNFRSLPIVFWLAENDAINAGTAISSLGSMRVWIAPDA
ncbi:hypothetical protein, partial [Pseudochrobactrum kiredjianiae]